MKLARAGLLILNHGAEFCKDDNVIFIDEDQFLRVQKLF